MPTIVYVTAKRCQTCAVNTLVGRRGVDAATIGHLPQDKPLRATLTVPRNRKVHNLYFKAIEVAAKHWPHDLEPYPEGDSELLRAWLQCKAGHCHRFGPAPPEAVSWVVPMIQLIRAKDKFAFVEETTVDGKGAMVVLVPLSVDYESADDEAFRPVKTKVFEFIEGVFNMPVKTLIEEDEKAL